MSILFTQYLMPDGRKKEVFFQLDDPEIERKALLLIAEKKLHFDIEMLPTGVISMTCEDSEDVIAIELSENGPEVVGAVTRLVETAYSRVYSQ